MVFGLRASAYIVKTIHYRTLWYILGWHVNIWLNHIRWGFKTWMGMETIVITTIPNYGKVGFLLDNGHQLLPLMHLIFRASPSLGLGSQWTSHFSWLFGVWYSLYAREMETKSTASKVSIVDFIAVFDNLLCGFNSSCSSSFIIRGCKYPGWRNTR